MKYDRVGRAISKLAFGFAVMGMLVWAVAFIFDNDVGSRKLSAYYGAGFFTCAIVSVVFDMIGVFNKEKGEQDGSGIQSGSASTEKDIQDGEEF